MIERRSEPRFAQKAGFILMIFGRGGIFQRLKGDAPAENRVFGEINHAHSAFTEFFENQVLGNFLSYHFVSLGSLGGSGNSES